MSIDLDPAELNSERAVPMDFNPSRKVLEARDDFDDSELLECGALFSAKYLNARAMIRFGCSTINTTSLKRRFDSLFPGHLNDWVSGMVWASDYVQIANRKRIVQDVRVEIKEGMHPTDERMIDAVFAAIGLDV